jgi:hypothetical protein
MPAWEANSGNTLLPGETYRIRATVRGPYGSLYVGLMRTAFKWECFARDWDYVSVDSAPPMLSAHSGSFTPWTVTLSFRPRGQVGVSEAGLDPRGLAVLAGVIVASALALVLIEPKLERLVSSVGDNVVRPITDPIARAVSPFQILIIGAAVVAAFYFTRGR